MSYYVVLCCVAAIVRGAGVQRTAGQSCGCRGPLRTHGTLFNLSLFSDPFPDFFFLGGGWEGSSRDAVMMTVTYDHHGNSPLHVSFGVTVLEHLVL